MKVKEDIFRKKMEKSTLIDVFVMKKLGLVLDQCFSTGGSFVPQEAFGNVWTHF